MIGGIRFLGRVPTVSRLDENDLYTYPFSVRSKIYVRREYADEWSAFLGRLGMEISGYVGEESDVNGCIFHSEIGDFTWTYMVTNRQAVISRWRAHTEQEMMYAIRMGVSYFAGVTPQPQGMLNVPGSIAGPQGIFSGPLEVVGIGSGAFMNFDRITDVTIPAGVKAIGNVAFSRCPNLRTLTLPESLTDIGDFTFAGCTNLTPFVTPAGLTAIGRGAFAWCHSLAYMNFSGGNPQVLGDMAFYGCENLSSVNYGPHGSIGALAFADCPNLHRVEIWAGVTNIGDEAYVGCTALTSAVIRCSNVDIGSFAFAGCTSLIDAQFAGNGLASLGTGAFEGCESMEKLTVAGGIRQIDSFTFMDCRKLATLVFNSPIGDIRDISVFDGCQALTSVYYANGLPGTGLTSEERVHGIYSSELYTAASPYLVSYVKPMQAGMLPDSWGGRPVASWLAYPEAPICRIAEFNLRRRAERTGGGELLQRVVAGGEVLEPEIVPERDLRFIGWELDYTYLAYGMRLAARYADAEGKEAADFYVSTEGDDSNDGLSRATAFRTIQRAIEAAHNDSLVLVGEGTYPSVSWIAWPTQKHVVVRSEKGKDRTFITGGGTNRCVLVMDYYNHIDENPFVDGEMSYTIEFHGFTMRDGRIDVNSCQDIVAVCGSFAGGGVLGGTYVDCVVTGCVVNAGGEAGYGGGAYGALLYGTSILGCGIENADSGAGGGAYECELSGCTLEANRISATSEATGEQQASCRTNAPAFTGFADVGDYDSVSCRPEPCFVVDSAQNSSISVPEKWLNENLGLTVEWCNAHSSLATSLLQTKAANGRMSIAECYVVGVDPESATNDFKITSFPMKADGTPDLENIAFDPPEVRWNVPGARPVVKGAATLDGEWQAVTEENKAGFRFFKVEVVLP